MATKYKIAFNKLKATWKRTKKVKGKKHVSWSGKRGAFAAIAKAASKEAGAKTKKRKPSKTKKRAVAKKRKAPKRRTTKARRATPKRKAKPRRRVAKKPRRTAPKRSAPRAKRKNPSKAKGSTRRYVVSGKSRSITPYRAGQLRKAGKKVRLAKAKSNPGRRRARTRGKAGIGTLALVAGAVVVAGTIGYLATRKKAQ